MLKRICAFFTVFLLLCSQLSISSQASALSLSAESAVLLNGQTNEIIYEKNAYEKRGMASTTKIMTALLALECAKAQQYIVAEENEVRVEGTSIGLKAGDRISLGTLIAGMLLESGNDAANVTAWAVGGSKENFVALMNQRARELGMENTCFKNPSGLPDDGHYSTAYDMALLGSTAIKNKEFRDICSKTSMRVSYGTPEYQRTFTNHNKFLQQFDGAFGIKTGFTKASGRCLVTAAERDGVTLVAVTLGAPDDWNDHKKLMEYGFRKVKVYTENFDTDAVRIHVVGSNVETVGVSLASELTYTSSCGEADTSTVVLCEPFLYSGVKKGDEVGSVKLYSADGRLLCESNLLSTKSAQPNFTEEKSALTLWEKFKKIIENQIG